MSSMVTKKCRNKDCIEPNPQSLEKFGKDKSKKDGRCTRCIACDRAYRALNSNRLKSNYSAYYKLNSEKRKLTTRNYHYIKTYGITFEQKQQMLHAQKHVCANVNCGYVFQNISEACVDHSHVTGKVRALLCSPCNASLGLLKENFERIVGLAKYAQDHKEVITI